MDRPRILLADDHAEFLSLARRLLEPEFDVVKSVETGQAALDEIDRIHPDLLVMDITMPGLSGLETARRLRSEDDTAKIVFVTVHKDPDYLRSAMAAGALGYVVKDHLASDLIPAMHAALAGRPFVSSTISQAQNP